MYKNNFVGIKRYFPSFERYPFLDILVIAGGIIPPQDHQVLFDKGVIAIFGPGTNLAEAACKILALMT
ncbi:MAG: hypothetical protein IPK94_16075 [Saprospiraceae bacterium]|nr:hypothetical protein [Saprospiraceae bacterium]